jgi:hypothetical protein
LSETETPDVTEDDDDAVSEPIEPPAPDEDGEEEAETPATVAGREGSADVAKKLERSVADHKRRLSRILDQDLDGCECPTCGGMGYTPGGAADEPDLVHPDNLVACEACRGYGQLITGSRNPAHQLAICTACTGFGFITKQAAPAIVTPLPTHAPDAQAAQAGTLLPDGRFLPFGATEPIVIQPGYGA